MSEDATLDEFGSETNSEKQQKSSNWVRQSITEISEWTDAGGTPRTSNDAYWGGDISWVQTGELTKRHISSTEKNITKLGLNESTAKRFPSGTLLIGMYGEPTVGESALLETEATTNQACCGIFPSTDVVNAEFLHQMMQYEKPRLYSLRAGSGQQNIRQETIRKFEIGIPPLSEQRKIATVLHTVDQAIQKTQQIETQLQRTQDSLIQTFLNEGIGNSEIRETKTKLGQIPEHWEVATIDEIIADEEDAFTDGARYSLSSAEIHSEGDARAILLEEVGEADFRDTTPKFATQEKYEEITHRAIYQGEVVVAKMAEPVARACIVPETYDKYLLGCADVVRIVPNDEVDDRFLMHCMNSHIVWRQAVAHLRGTGRSRINLENIAELKIPKPPLSEQEQIAEILHEYDRKIENERAYQNQLQLLKHGLMQDLLSGEVRTTDVDMDIPEAVAKYG